MCYTEIALTNRYIHPEDVTWANCLEGKP